MADPSSRIVRWIAAAAVSCLVGCGSTDDAPAPSTAAPVSAPAVALAPSRTSDPPALDPPFAPVPFAPPPCPEGDPSAEQLWAALDEPTHERFGGELPEAPGDEPSPWQADRVVLTAELDGAPPRESVLAVDTVDRDSARDGGREILGAIWIFRCRDGALRSVASTEYVVAPGWNRAQETEWTQLRGFQEVRVERLLSAPTRDVIRAEWLASARCSEIHTYDLYALREDRLERIFECPTHDSSYCAPDGTPQRGGGRERSRDIRLSPTRIRVRSSSYWQDITRQLAPNDGLPAEEAARSAEYRFDGTRYASATPLCGED